jgi:hypothetical protein
VKLGCVQPGEAVATFGDPLRRLMPVAETGGDVYAGKIPAKAIY